MSKSIEMLLKDAVKDGKIDDDELKALSAELKNMREELQLNREIVGKLLNNLNSVSTKLAARVVEKVEAINVARTANAEFCEVSIAPEMIRLKLPFDPCELWDTEVIDMMCDALADQLTTLFLTKDKRVHYNKIVHQEGGDS